MTQHFTLMAEGARYHAHWPTTVSVPVDQGKVEEQLLETHFNQLTADEVKVHFEAAVKALSLETGESDKSLKRLGPLNVIFMHIPTSEAFLEAAIHNIEKLSKLDKKGAAQPLAYDPSVLKNLCQVEYVRKAMLLAYFSFHTGIAEKN